MNPKDEVKFEDIKKLVNASLEKFYKNDRDLIEILYLIFDYPHKHYTFKHFEV